MKSYSVYILECSDQSYYTGVINNLEKRIAEHKYGIDPKCYTYKRRPLELKFVEEFNDVNQAIAREKQLKRWTKRKKKALIEHNFEELVRLSKCHDSTSSP